MRAGAEILVRTCADVRPGESAVIVADPERARIGRALRIAVEDAGGVPTLLIPPPRSIDNEEPGDVVASALTGADVVFLPVTLAMAHTQAVREAIEEGARVLSMTAFTERMMREGGLFTDFHARKPICDAMANRLSRGSRLRVVSSGGTDLEMSLVGCHGHSHSCLLSGPGFTAVPNIEANVAPDQGTATGTFVVDGSIPYYGVGVISDPVEMAIKGGVVYGIEGGHQAEFLRELLARQEDPRVYNVAQFAFGLNPDCTRFTGEMLNDEGVNGTIHLGVGTSASLGGSVSAKTHFDAIIRAPTVWIDGELVVEDGQVVLDSEGSRPY